LTDVGVTGSLTKIDQGLGEHFLDNIIARCVFVDLDDRAGVVLTFGVADQGGGAAFRFGGLPSTA
jgi:hypothetical protein